MTSLLAFGRRCHLASYVFLLASSLDFLQGTFEKIHLHRLLGEHSLQLADLLKGGAKSRAVLTYCALVGAIAMSRAVSDGQLSREILKTVAQRLKNPAP
jgi:hypothetical protein